MDMTGKKMLVVAAHPGDVLWRCSGAIAKHVKLGGTVDVIVCTYGTGGEANELFKAGYTVESAKKQRFDDFSKAMEILGVSFWENWDMQDYQFEITRDKVYKLAGFIRRSRPDLILTHHEKDILNPDHGTIFPYVVMSLETATGQGIFIEGTEPAERAPIYCFEPHASEVNGFNPNIFIDITDVIETKKAAMATFELKAPLAESYVLRARIRGQNATSFGRKGCRYAEAYEHIYPIAQDGFFVY